MSQDTLAHLIGGGPGDGWVVPTQGPWPTICVPYALTPFGPYYSLYYKRVASDPDGMLATYEFEGWPEELEEWLTGSDDRT